MPFRIFVYRDIPGNFNGDQRYSAFVDLFGVRSDLFRDGPVYDGNFASENEARNWILGQRDARGSHYKIEEMDMVPW